MADKKKKTLTWAEMKKIVNRIPKDRLKDEVIIWTDRDDDASAFRVRSVDRLEEDYLSGEEGCIPRSVVNSLKKDDPEQWEDEFKDAHIVHQKGKRIIYAE